MSVFSGQLRKAYGRLCEISLQDWLFGAGVTFVVKGVAEWSSAAAWMLVGLFCIALAVLANQKAK